MRLALILIAGTLWAQPPLPRYQGILARGPSCTTPAGTSLTESFGDTGSGACFTGGAGCNQPWIQTGGTPGTIGTSPGTPPANTACTNSLHFVRSGTAYLESAGTFSRIPEGTAFDLRFSTYFASCASAGNNRSIIAASHPTGCGSPGTYSPASVFTDCTSMYGYGSTISAGLTRSNTTWQQWRLHQDATAANCSLSNDDSVCPSADTATCKKFTCNASAGTFPFDGVAIGNCWGSFAQTFDVGNVRVDSALGPAELLHVDFEAGTNNTAPTATTLQASSHGAAGYWSTNATAGNLIYSTTGQQALHTPVVSGGSSRDGSGTLALRLNAGAYQTVVYHPVATTGNISAAQWSQSFYFSIHELDTNLYSIASITGNGATDYATVQVSANGQIRLEAPSGDGGSAYTLSADEKVCISLQYVAGGTHTLKVYNTSGVQVGTTRTRAATGTVVPVQMDWGRDGGEPGQPATQYWTFDNIVADVRAGIVNGCQ